ncbi:MAG: hypothetical protein WD847_06065 [Pirellulales bacterium]
MSKSRWFRYSLRTGLLVVTCLAIAFAWFGHYANQRKAAFSAIRQAGGDIRMGIREPSLLEEWFGAELFGSVEEVNLRKGQADNALGRGSPAQACNTCRATRVSRTWTYTTPKSTTQAWSDWLIANR